MKLPTLLLALAMSAAFSSGAHGATDASKVTLTDKPQSAVLANGIVSVEIAKISGDALSLLYQGQAILGSPGYVNWHAESDDEEEKKEKAVKGNQDTFNRIRTGIFKVVTDPAKNDGQMADVSITQKYAGQGAPFDVELHYVLRSGDSGFYQYVILRHPGGYPAGQLSEGRMLYRVNEKVFDYISIDDDRRRYMPPPGTPYIELGPKEAMQMTDGPFKGVIEYKYRNFVDIGDHYVHGWEGSKSGLGCWIINGSTEDENGGPTKQQNTEHFPQVLMKNIICTHYGSAPVTVGTGSWEKIYGPFMVYLNAGRNLDAMWADAKARADTEKARWPYAWMDNALYPNANGRGGVTGQLRLSDAQDPSASASNAWVGLAGPSPDWQQQTNDYQYWVRADGEGRFHIANVRPGTYTLYAFTDGVMGEYRHDSVTVKAGDTGKVDLPDWKPVHYGTQVWQVGVPDRTAREFRHGDDYREWGLPAKYATEFPNDVNFVIGKSHERTDWNYAQCSVLRDGKWMGTKWNISFEMPNDVKPGTATLRIALAAAHKADLVVYVNGKVVDSHAFDTDNAMIRAGIHGQYSLWDVHFDTVLLKGGQNVITLEQRSGKNQLKNVMYDCLRFEIAQK